MKKIALIALLFVVGCSVKLQPPTLTAPQSYLYADSNNIGSLTLREDWWTMFGDTTLNRLVSSALAANNNLKTAASRIEEARDNMRSARSVFLPSFTLGRTVGLSGGGGFAQQYAIEPAVSWEIPLFGSLRHATTSALADIEYAKWQYQGVRLALAAEVATTYFTLLQYRRDLDIAKRSSQLRKESAVLIDSIFVRGMATGVNREQAMNLLYTAEADIPLYERAVRQTLLSLDVLLGSNPDSLAYNATVGTLITDYTPIEIPAGVPSDIITRRPDMMSAYSALVSSAADVKSARVARFPSFTLTGEGGVVSDDIKKLFHADSWGWSVLLSFAQPIYNFGALKSREAAAVERYNQSLFAYNQCFIEALEEVESALVSIATYREETKKYSQLVQSNAKIAKMTTALYNNGLSAYLDVIDAERTLYNSQMQYSNIIAQQYINYVNLCKALGGGF